MDQTTVGVTSKHVGQIVDTAGWVKVVWAADERRVATVFPDLRFPPGLRFILKHVDERNRAFLYRDDMGVVMFPATLVDPYSR